MTILAALLLAASLDPRFVWNTIDTPHFEVHYHQGQYRLAQKVARIAEDAHRRLAPLLDHVPAERCQIVVQDDTDFANGNATPLLYNQIHAYAPPPDPRSTLADFDDNAAELINHEYTHILHLDTVLGLPAAANGVFGKIWIPNGGQPVWFIEGMATFTESELSGAGRVRSSQDDMMVRAQALGGVFPRIDRLSNSTLIWPRGFGQYTIGSRFLNWLDGEYGLGALRDLSHDYGGRAIPLSLNFSARRVLGTDYLDLYSQYTEWETRRAERMEEEVRAAGASRIEPLTRLGEWVRSPRWSPDGATLYYTWSGPDELPHVRALEPGRCCEMPAAPPRDRDVATLYSDGSGDDTLTVRRDGRVVYARKQIYQQFELVQDLYEVDPKTGVERRLTRGLRAREPDAGADGTLVFTRHQPAGRTQIALLEPGATEPRVVFEDPDGGPVGEPRLSPDGKRIAFVHHRDGAWDLRIVPREGGEPIDVTHDRALDRDPAWTPDGKNLLWSSDRTGVYDVYAWSAEDGLVRRVTRVALGAFEPEPSPDGTQLAVVTYSSRGYDVGRLPLDPSSWPLAPARIAANDRPPVEALPPDEVFPARPYSPWATLRPHFWLPYVNLDASGTTLGALTAGLDAVDRHEYAAIAWWGLKSKQPGWDVSYLNHSFYPDLTLNTSRDVGTVSGMHRGYTERFWGGSITADVPFSQIERSQALSLSYQLYKLATNSTDVDPVVDARLAAATLTYSYSDARRFVRSISSEEGQRLTLSLRVSDPALGSSFSFWQLYSAVSRYLAMPWTRGGRSLHHVLALRGSFGISRGDLSGRHLYGLGGFEQGNLVTAVLNPVAAPVRVLRGFSTDAFVGSAYLLGTAEYRLPLLDVDVGAWTLPVYLRRLHGAIFTDLGDAWTPGARDFGIHAGVGGELRAEVVLGYILPTDVRLGCARGLEATKYDRFGAYGAILDCYAALGGVF